MNSRVITIHDYNTDENDRAIADAFMSKYGVNRNECDRIEWDEETVTFRIVAENGKRTEHARWLEYRLVES